MHLSLSNEEGHYKNQLGPPVFEYMPAFFNENKTITMMDLQGNWVGDEGFQLFRENIEFQAHLIHLDISQIEITVNSADNVYEMLDSLNLQSLVIGKNKLKSYTISLLSKAVLFKNSIKKLNLSDCHIGKKGQIALFNSLGYNRSLFQLILDDNKISNQALNILKQNLYQNNSLTILSLSNCSIDDEGMIYLMDLMHSPSKVEKMNLKSNQFGVSLNLFQLLDPLSERVSQHFFSAESQTHPQELELECKPH